MGQVAQTVIQAISDLLTIKPSMSGDKDDDDSDDTSNETNENNDPVFNSQLYLFEAIGCIASASTIPIENKILYTQSIINPIFSDLEQNLGAAKNGDERAIMQIHHDIMAIGNLAHGFTDWMPGVKASEPPPTQMSDEFVKCGEAILVALESLSSSFGIRQAARYSLSRLLGGMGTRVFQQLPRWIEGLLSQTSSKDEMSFFLRLLGQTIFAFKADISSILDAILSPLLQRMFERLSEPVTGTDDEMSLTALRREFLTFILTVLTYDLGSVFISSSK
jgi:exportin-T